MRPSLIAPPEKALATKLHKVVPPGLIFAAPTISIYPRCKENSRPIFREAPFGGYVAELQQRCDGSILKANSRIEWILVIILGIIWGA